jgi:hypothetical protein
MTVPSPTVGEVLPLAVEIKNVWKSGGIVTNQCL